jgi:hypothetical protein
MTFYSWRLKYSGLDQRLYHNNVELHLIQPGKPFHYAHLWKAAMEDFEMSV